MAIFAMITEEHDAIALAALCPCAQFLHHYLLRQCPAGNPQNFRLSEFVDWAAQFRGKGYSLKWVKIAIAQLQEVGLLKIVDKFSGQVLRLVALHPKKGGDKSSKPSPKSSKPSPKSSKPQPSKPDSPVPPILENLDQAEQPEIENFEIEEDPEESNSELPTEEENHPPATNPDQSEGKFPAPVEEFNQALQELREANLMLNEQIRAAVKNNWGNVRGAIAYLKEAIRTWKVPAKSWEAVFVSALKVGKKPENSLAPNPIQLAEKFPQPSAEEYQRLEELKRSRQILDIYLSSDGQTKVVLPGCRMIFWQQYLEVNGHA